MKDLANRPSLGSREFCERCDLDSRLELQVDAFREAFSKTVRIGRDRIYPEDEAPDLGFNYSDDLGMFLFENSLLTNTAYRHDFPMEDASSVGGIIKLTLKLNDLAQPNDKWNARLPDGER